MHGCVVPLLSLDHYTPGHPGHAHMAQLLQHEVQTAARLAGAVVESAAARARIITRANAWGQQQQQQQQQRQQATAATSNSGAATRGNGSGNGTAGAPAQAPSERPELPTAAAACAPARVPPPPSRPAPPAPVPPPPPFLATTPPSRTLALTAPPSPPCPPPHQGPAAAPAAPLALPSTHGTPTSFTFPHRTLPDGPTPRVLHLGSRQPLAAPLPLGLTPVPLSPADKQRTCEAPLPKRLRLDAPPAASGTPPQWTMGLDVIPMRDDAPAARLTQQPQLRLSGIPAAPTSDASGSLAAALAGAAPASRIPRPAAAQSLQLQAPPAVHGSATQLHQPASTFKRTFTRAFDGPSPQQHHHHPSGPPLPPPAARHHVTAVRNLATTASRPVPPPPPSRLTGPPQPPPPSHSHRPAPSAPPMGRLTSRPGAPAPLPPKPKAKAALTSALKPQQPRHRPGRAGSLAAPPRVQKQPLKKEQQPKAVAPSLLVAAAGVLQRGADSGKARRLFSGSSGSSSGHLPEAGERAAPVEEGPASVLGKRKGEAQPLPEQRAPQRPEAQDEGEQALFRGDEAEMSECTLAPACFFLWSSPRKHTCERRITLRAWPHLLLLLLRSRRGAGPGPVQ